MSRKRIIAVLLVVSFAVTGCIGSFGAFNKLLAWNKKVTDQKWGNELIFLGLNIIPVYGLAFLGDILIFNAIEFWGGSNPMKAAVDTMGDHRAVQSFTRDGDGNHLTVSFYFKDALDCTLTMSQAEPSAPLVGRVTRADGSVEEFSARRHAGSILVTRTDASGDVTARSLSSEELQEITRRLDVIPGRLSVARAD